MVFMVPACTSGYRNPNESKPVTPGEVRLAPDALSPRRADADARAALAKGDLHLTAVYGFTTLAPGAPNDEIPADWPHSYLVIEDTSDFLRDKDHDAFNERAIAYARAYNQVVLEDARPPRN